MQTAANRPTHSSTSEVGFVRAMARELLVRHAGSMSVEQALGLASELLRKSSLLSNPQQLPAHTHEADHVELANS